MKGPYTELRNRFFAKLEEKTGWGRNQIRDAFDEVVAELLDEFTKPVRVPKARVAVIPGPVKSDPFEPGAVLPGGSQILVIDDPIKEDRPVYDGPLQLTDDEGLPIDIPGEGHNSKDGVPQAHFPPWEVNGDRLTDQD